MLNLSRRRDPTPIFTKRFLFPCRHVSFWVHSRLEVRPSSCRNPFTITHQATLALDWHVALLQELQHRFRAMALLGGCLLASWGSCLPVNTASQLAA